MIIDVDGLPKDVGATDKMDSSRLAGIMVSFDHLLAPDLSKYIVQDDQAVRHPHEFPADNPGNFSRDQLLCLIAGLHKQGRIDICKKLYEAARSRWGFAQNYEEDVPGSKKKLPHYADWLSPSNMMTLKKAAGGWGNPIGYAWLILEIILNAVSTPEGEPNQLISQLLVCGPMWIKFYKLITPKWRNAIRLYWSGWRGEPELSELMIAKLEAI